MPPMQETFVILIVGMLTVFTILGLVVGSGRLLIWLVNRWEPQTVSRPSATSATIPDTAPVHSTDVVVLTAAVEAITAGKGRIESIEKI